MKSFEPGVLERQVLPSTLAATLRRLGEYRVRLGSQHLPAGAGERLHAAAVAADIDSANRLDGLGVPQGRVPGIVTGQAGPDNAGEQRLAGYRDALSSIGNDALAEEFTPQAVLRLHARLCRYTPEGGGSWKVSDDLVTETLPDGSTTVIFTPVPAYAVEDAMGRLHESFGRRWREGAIDPLLLIPAYLLDFQCIHPVADATDGMARLLGRLLLRRAGYAVDHLFPLDVLFERSTAARSGALQASWRGWHGATHNLAAWITCLIGIVLDACQQLERQLETAAPPRGAKRDAVAAAIERLPIEFRYADLERLVPAVSRPTINRALRRLRQQRVVQCVRPGRNARWHRLPLRECT